MATDAKSSTDEPGYRGILYTSDSARSIESGALHHTAVAEDQLLWIDLLAPSRDLLAKVWSALQVDQASLELLTAGSPALELYSGWFGVRSAAVNISDDMEFKGEFFTLFAGTNVVLSVHDSPLTGIEELEAQRNQHRDVACLGSGSFVAALLDWQLSTYFVAVAKFESEIDRLETRILAGADPGRELLPRLRILRRAASRLRRMLAPHRSIFAGLARPDFATDGQSIEARHYRAADQRFTSAMDAVENARDLVVGSFELFSSQTGLQTNDNMRVLTFATVVTGLLAVIAGVLGMNFEASFFKSASLGFWVAVGVMLALGAVAVGVGRRRAWI